jgi:hypothetical protein
MVRWDYYRPPQVDAKGRSGPAAVIVERSSTTTNLAI